MRVRKIEVPCFLVLITTRAVRSVRLQRVNKATISFQALEPTISFQALEPMVPVPLLLLGKSYLTVSYYEEYLEHFVFTSVFTCFLSHITYSKGT